MQVLLAIGCVALVAGGLVLLVLWKRASAKLAHADEAQAALAARVRELQPFQGVLDATRAEAEVRERTASFAQDAEAQRASMLSAAAAEATAIVSDAKTSAAQIRGEGERLRQQAVLEANSLVAQANAKAEEIAGAAWEAKRNADEYAKTVKAIRNIIEGYGDEYLIPNLSVLDELAEELSHKEAGIKLQAARTRTRAMISRGEAADCDYVQASRRTPAIHFVIDAFNGKVDSILSTVRHNNYGKLKREIEDAFSVVNLNGEAFRKARVLPDFLQSRLEELRWAVAANELKLKEREEQARIREAIREEEKARREYEKAVKEAQKEERMLEKAMAAARKKLEGAHAEERLEYERQLAELQVKWAEAEAKNQRALSMAQQTKRGHVYIISNEGSFGENVYKIGLTRRLQPMDRVKELGDASVPFPFDVHAMIYSEDAPSLEKDLHRHFAEMQMNKVNARKEFFRIQLAEIRARVEHDGLEAHWTMKAEAAEFRESKAVERTRGTRERVPALA